MIITRDKSCATNYRRLIFKMSFHDRILVPARCTPAPENRKISVIFLFICCYTKEDIKSGIRTHSPLAMPAPTLPEL